VKRFKLLDESYLVTATIGAMY